MKATIETRRFYTITSNGVTSEGWEETSSWNGFVKLEKNGQSIIAVMEDELSSVAPIMDMLLADDHQHGLLPIKASASLHSWLRMDGKKGDD